MLRRTSVYVSKIKNKLGRDNESILANASNAAEDGHRKRSLTTETQDEPAKRRNTGLGGASGSYCDECDTLFSRPYTFYRHLDIFYGGPPKYACDVDQCSKLFTRQDILDRHKSTQHGHGKLVCFNCGAHIRRDGLRDHEKTATCRKSRSVNPSGPHIGESTAAEVSPYVADETMVPTHTLNPLIEANENLPDPASNSFVEAEQSQAAPSPQDEKLQHLAIMIQEAPRIIEEHCGTGLHANYEPDVPSFSGTSNTALTQPREVLESDITLDLLMMESHDEPELTQSILRNRAAMTESGAFAESLKAPAVEQAGQGFLQPHRPGRKYDMAFGSECALCPESLGVDAKTVLTHAQSHAQSHSHRRPTCQTCYIEFAFETDLRLHSSSLEIWSFCSEFPAEVSPNPDDWVGQAYLGARQSFITLLRLWESLQLRWYLSAIYTVIHRNTFQPLAARPEVSTFVEHDTLYYAVRANTVAGPPVVAGEVEIPRTSLTTTTPLKSWEYTERKTLDDLLDKFAQISLAQAKSSNRQAPPPLPPLTGTINEVFPLVQSRIWNAAEYGSEIIWEETLSDIKSKCPDEQTLVLILETALREAAWEGRLDIVTRLVILEGTNINAIYQFGPPALIHAIMNGQSKCAKTLIEKRADIHVQCIDGSTALHYACEYGLEEVVRTLLNWRADFNVVDADGNTPLIRTLTRSALSGSQDAHSIELTKLRIVNLLVSQSAAVNHQNQEGLTPLHRACHFDFRAIARTLLEHGARWDALDNHGNTPLQLAVREGRLITARFLLNSIAEQETYDGTRQG